MVTDLAREQWAADWGVGGAAEVTTAESELCPAAAGGRSVGVISSHRILALALPAWSRYATCDILVQIKHSCVQPCDVLDIYIHRYLDMEMCVDI